MWILSLESYIIRKSYLNVGMKVGGNIWYIFMIFSLRVLTRHYKHFLTIVRIEDTTFVYDVAYLAL